MKCASATRTFTLFFGGLAIASVGFLAGCSAKQSPTPTEPTSSHVDSKRANDDLPAGKEDLPESFAPTEKAPAAKTVNPAEDIAPGQPGRDNN